MAASRPSPTTARNSRAKATRSTGKSHPEHHLSQIPTTEQATPRHTHGNRASDTRPQAHETLKTMTTIIMRTSDDNRMWSFLALFQGFRFLGNLPITLVSPRGTHRHPRIIRERSTTLPALSVFADRHGKVQYPLWFHDVPHGWCPEAFTRQHVSMADNRQNDTQPVQPSQPPMASKSIPNPTGPLQTAQISWLMVQSRLRRHRPNSRNGQLRSMISALSASSRSRTPMADRIAWLRDGMVEVTRATNAEKRPNNSK